MTDPTPTQADLDLAEEILGIDGYEHTKWAIAAALASQRAELAAQLRTAAAGRTEYAGGCSVKETNSALRAQRAALEIEAQALECAAKIVEGDPHVMLSLLPSWRWTPEMKELAHG